MRARCLIPILAALIAGACGSSPSAPSTAPPPAQTLRWNLTGTVTAAPTGAPIGGAIVSIVDGPNAGSRATTEPNGRYAFGDVIQAGFTLRVTATDYAEMTQAVTLTANAVVNVQLPGIAKFTFGGPIIFTRRSDGGFDMRALATNTGTGCALTVAGVAVITNASTGDALSFPWSLPRARVVQIGERFEYSMGVMTDQQALRFQEAAYVTSVTFANASCS